MTEYAALGKVIEYRNDFFGEGKTKKVFVYGFDARYPGFLKVVDFPIKPELNKYRIWGLGEKKESKKQLNKSGEWYIFKRNLSKRKKRYLEKKLEKEKMENKKTLEDNIEYYHMQFNNFFNLVELGKREITNEQKETVKKLIQDYRENFKNNPEYLETLPSLAEYLLS